METAQATPPAARSTEDLCAEVQPRILVADDQEVNLRLLGNILEREGYAVEKCSDGTEVLARLESMGRLPDLVLLDVKMPGMDGLETCKRLIAHEAWSTIPIIFITAQDERTQKIEGLKAGAVDYLTKPIDVEETLARVRTHLRLTALNRQNLSLQKRLAESRKSAAIGSMTEGIAHNLNNMLGIVVGYLDLLKISYKQAEEVPKSVQVIDKTLQRMVKIMRTLTSMAARQPDDLQEHSLDELLRGAITRLREEYGLSARLHLPETLPDVRLHTNAEAVEGALDRLIANACESYGEDAGPEPEVWLEAEVKQEGGEGKLFVRILDRGKGIDPAVEEHMFEPFISTKASVGAGMGLTAARRSLRSLGGEVRLYAREDGPGTCAQIEHPVAGS